MEEWRYGATNISSALDGGKRSAAHRNFWVGGPWRREKPSLCLESNPDSSDFQAETLSVAEITGRS
jgi:hypothetical protein